VDIHTAHCHGNNAKFEKKNIDTLELLPSSFLTSDGTRYAKHASSNTHVSSLGRRALGRR